jgi:hypothetical protein
MVIIEVEVLCLSELNVDMDVVEGAEGVGEVSKESRRAGVVAVVATVQERPQELRWLRPPVVVAATNWCGARRLVVDIYTGSRYVVRTDENSGRELEDETIEEEGEADDQPATLTTPGQTRLGVDVHMFTYASFSVLLSSVE